jgi:hypothetical protein
VDITSDGYGEVTVIGSGSMDIENYVAGLGEIPDKACGSAEQVAENPDKYVVNDRTTLWDCWPAESIKAQVIAARSYALSQGEPLQPNANDQVYKGGNGKQWAVEETAHQVIRHNGEIIRAYYSSDNNQGHGTANHETMWNDYAGNLGEPLPYIRAVDDTQFARSSEWTNWQWTTRSFTMTDLQHMMQARSARDDGVGNFVAGVLTTVGTIESLELHYGPSRRVAKVTLHGTEGTHTMAGWLLQKSIWNSYLDSTGELRSFAGSVPENAETLGLPESGQVPYIYSLTFSLFES